MADIGKCLLIAKASGHLLFSFRAGRWVATKVLGLVGIGDDPETDSDAWDVEGKVQAEGEGETKAEAKALGNVGDEKCSDGDGEGDGEERGDGDE